MKQYQNTLNRTYPAIPFCTIFFIFSLLCPLYLYIRHTMYILKHNILSGIKTKSVRDAAAAHKLRNFNYRPHG